MIILNEGNNNMNATMIILNEGNNNMNATCSRNKMLTGPVCYLFSWKHKLSQEVWRFVPYQIPATVNYAPGYDLFSISINPNSPETGLTGATSTGYSGTTDIYKIYEG